MNRVLRKTAMIKILLALFAVALFFIVAANIGNVKASADSGAAMRELYAYFSFENTYSNNTSTSVLDSATNTLSATVRTGQTSSDTIFFKIKAKMLYDDSFPNGGYICSSEVYITVSFGSVIVKDADGNIVASGSGTLTVSGLSNGTYKVTTEGGEGWLVNARRYDQVHYTAGFAFTVDTTSPVISGASSSTTGKVVNAAFGVYAQDGESGMKNLYMKGPNDSSWSAYESSKTVSSGSVNGLYQFYAMDNAGNTTSTHYVYYDNVKPTVGFYTSGYVKIKDGKTNTAFLASAADSGIGINYMQYKSPTDTSWKSYTQNTIISESSANGEYVFRAVDKAGNISDEYSLFLDDSESNGTIYVNETPFYGAYTNKSFYYDATDDGSGINRLEYKLPNTTDWVAYTSKTEIATTRTNGTYQFRAIDNSGNVSGVSSIYLDTVKPVGNITDTSGGAMSNTTNKGFKYSATDSGSGIAYLQYSSPNGSSWITYVSGTVIENTDGNGQYTFRAVDNAGNISNVSSVVLDTEPPTGKLFGGTAIISNNGKTCAQYVKFIPSDVLSGVRYIYVKTPDSSSYKSYISGSQLAEEGKYKFYCIDNANNYSAVYNITLDKSAPVLSCLETEFYSTYGLGFTVSVSDAIGTAKLYYKTPSSSEYQLCPTTSYYTDFDSENGKYYFFGMDDLGNTTQAYWIDLQIGYPDPTIVESSGTDNKVKIIWTNGDYALLNGKNYDQGTWITEEGDYTIKVVNNYGLETTETFSITHNYVVASVVNPTCTEDGYSLYKCTSCGDEYKSNIRSATGHNYKEEVVDATCIAGGYVKHNCLNCGDCYETDHTQALGHKYTENTRAATCTEDGGVAHTCSVCGYEFLTETIKALGHNYSTQVSIIPHCETEGERQFLCERCSDEYFTEIPCTGHNFELFEEEDVDGKTVRTYVCTNCGILKTQDLGNEYEEVSNYMSFLIQQYEPYMLMGFLATTGIWSVVMGVFFAIAHKNDDKEKARKMIKNYLIGVVVIFAILVAAPYLIKGIAALISA